MCAYEQSKTGIDSINELHIYEKSHEQQIENVHESEKYSIYIFVFYI